MEDYEEIMRRRGRHAPALPKQAVLVLFSAHFEVGLKSLMEFCRVLDPVKATHTLSGNSTPPSEANWFLPSSDAMRCYADFSLRNNPSRR